MYPQQQLLLPLNRLFVIPTAHSRYVISFLWLTITSYIETWEFLEVGVLKAFVVPVYSSHYSRPGPLEYLQQNTRVTTENENPSKSQDEYLQAV